MNNLRYSLVESPHMWFILAGISALATLIGTMAIIIYDWSHVFARVYFYAGFALTIVLIVLGVLNWKDRMDELLKMEEAAGNRRAGD